MLCFCTYFSLQTRSFVDGSAKIFFLQGAEYPSYATGRLPLCLSIQNTLFSLLKDCLRLTPIRGIGEVTIHQEKAYGGIHIWAHAVGTQ